MSEKLKRILVIDDSWKRIYNSFILFGSGARNIQATRAEYIQLRQESTEKTALEYSEMLRTQISLELGSEAEIGRALGEEQYGVILIDGNLDLGLEGRYFDGEVIARKLREGVYGAVNQNTRMLSTSSNLEAIPEASGGYDLDITEGIKEYHRGLARKLLDS